MRRSVASSDDLLSAPAWRPDGSIISFVKQTRTESQLVLAILSAEPVLKTIGQGEDVFPFPAVWTDRSRYYYTADGLIKRREFDTRTAATIPFSLELDIDQPRYARKWYDFDASQARRVKGLRGPIASSNGEKVFVTALGDLWMLSTQREAKRLSEGPGLEIDPAPSPGGGRLVYASDADGDMDLWVLDLDSLEKQRLTDDSQNQSMPVWSPDGRYVAYLSSGRMSEWGRSAIDVVEVADGTVRRVAADLFGPGAPTWSADGKRIALSVLAPRTRRFREGRNEVRVIDISNGEYVQFAPASDVSIDTRGRNGPVWSPDGSEMAFVWQGNLWMLPVSGDGQPRGIPRRISAELAEAPSWTGDSSRLVFLSGDRLARINITDSSIDKPYATISWQPELPRDRYVLQLGRLFDSAAMSYRTAVDVFITGHRIEAIVPRDSRPHPPVVIDWSDKTALPGLIDMHAHLSTLIGERLGRIWLAYGITSVRDPGADPYDALERKEAWASQTRSGPRLFFTGQLNDGNRIYYDQARDSTSLTAAENFLQRAEQLEFDLLKIYVRLDDERQTAMIERAHALGIPVSSHEVYPALALGADAVEHLRGTSRRGYSPKQSQTHVSYHDITRLISATGRYITPTIALQGGFAWLATRDPAWLEEPAYLQLYSVEERFELESFLGFFGDPTALAINVGRMLQTQQRIRIEGGRILAGTDSPFIPYGLGLHAELALLAEAFDSPAAALQAATWHAAQALGTERDLGNLRDGMLADLCIVNGDPLTDLSQGLRVHAVVKNGRVSKRAILLRKPTEAVGLLYR